MLNNQNQCFNDSLSRTALNSVMSTLKQLLAEELFLDEDKIEEDTQFLDLGLDSITGVTWVKKINQAYEIQVPVAKIYSLPTLSELAPYVRDEVDKYKQNPIHLAGDAGSEKVLCNNKKERDNASAKLSDTEERPAYRSVMSNLKKLLAEELFLEEGQVEEETEFLELGLDSITGVTWVKKINQQYTIDIPVTKIYSLPTLSKLTPHVIMEIEKIGVVTDKPVDDISIHSIRRSEEDGKSNSSTIGLGNKNAATYIQQSEEMETSIKSTDHEVLTSVTSTLKRLLAEELFLDEEKIEEDSQFLDLGLDSITGVTWVRKINQVYRIDIPATKIYSLPTLCDLSRYVATALEERQNFPIDTAIDVNQGKQTSQAETRKVTLKIDREADLGSSRQASLASSMVTDPISHDAVEKVESHVADSSQKQQLIAIIGMAGKFPKAKNLNEYWEVIKSGENCISEIPRCRWDIDEYYHPDSNVPGKTNCKWIGALEEYDMFDPSFFSISPKEAEFMDPQQRLFLEACWHSIEDSGYNPMSLSGTRCGVFVGCGPGDYSRLLDDTELTAHGLMGGTTAVLAARISYFLNLQGPCLSIDTACSSSLVAIASACDSLVAGNSDLALAGGVCVMSGPSLHIMTSNAGMLSKAGRCFTFDQRADGFVPGEGVGVVFLKRLETAQEDGDPVYGVIQGWGVNQDGKTNGLAAPNPKAQTQLQTTIYNKYNINPEHIQLIEAHGTGTKIGDAIEIEGIKDSFSAYTEQKKYCALGSIKSNVGHSLHASGVLGVIKLLLALRHKQLPPSINFNALNEHIDIDDSPFYINTKCVDWLEPKKGPRQAAINSFGLNGTNAHLVIAEHTESYSVPMTAVLQLSQPVILPMSAKSKSQLIVYAQDLLQSLNSNPTLSLESLAYTFQIGRYAMKHRMAVVASSYDELKLGLQNFVSGESNSNLLIGEEKRKSDLISSTLEGRDYIEKLTHNKKFRMIAEFWVKGDLIPWHNLIEINTVHRLAGLPVYPFSRERYWIGQKDDLSLSSTIDEAVFVKRNSSKISQETTETRAQRHSHLGIEEKASLFLQQLIADQLRIPQDQVDPYISYYEMGLTSLHLLKITHSIKCKIEERFSATTFFECPTPADLVSYLVKKFPNALIKLKLDEIEQSYLPSNPKEEIDDAVESTGCLDKDCNINNNASEKMPSIIHCFEDRYQPFPLNDIQQSFYIGRKLGEDKVGCHIYLEIEMNDLDVKQLNGAWNRLCESHEMLRAIFTDNGKQRIMENTPLYEFEVVDLQEYNEQARVKYLRDIRAEMSHKVYEPTQWPLYEISVSICPDRQVVHFSIDELIVDALSIQLLLKQWQKLYVNSNWEIPRSSISFRDYTLATRKFEDSFHFQSDLEYWVRKLDDLPKSPSLPLNDVQEKTTKNRQYLRTTLNGTLEKDQWKALKNKLEKHNISPTVYLLSVFTEVLHVWCDQKQISIILTFFNRLLDPDLEKVVAPFASTNIFVSKEKGECNFREALQSNQKELFEDLDHNNVSGIRALRELKRRRKISNSVSIPIVFTSLLGYDIYDETTFMEKVSFSITQTPQVYFDHQIYEQNGALRYRWDVAKEYYASGMIELLFEDYSRVLSFITSNLDQWEIGTFNAVVRENIFIEGKKSDRDNDVELDRNISRPIDKDLILIKASDNNTNSFPLTDQQQAYAFGRSKYGSNISSQFYTYFEVDNLDVDRLELAWRKVMQVHEILSTVICQDGTQKVLEDVPTYKIKVNDLRDNRASSIQKELTKITSSMVTRLCPVGEWPYFDLQVSLTEEKKSRIHLSIDLIITDGPSIVVIVNDLFDLYQNPSKLPQKRDITFLDYILSLQNYKKTEGYKRSFQYWTDKFSDIPSGPELPMVDSITTHETERFDGILTDWKILKQRAKKMSISPGMILLAVYAEVLSEWSQSETFSIVIPSWERLPLHPDIDKIAGDFTSMSWLVIKRDQKSFSEKVLAYHQCVQEDLSHGAVSGLGALRRVAAKRGRNKMLSFPIVFTNLSSSPGFLLPNGFKQGESLSQTSQVHMDNMSTEHEEQLSLHWDVAKSIFPKGMMKEMFAGYQRVLVHLSNNNQGWSKNNFSDLINAQPQKYMAAISGMNSKNTAEEQEIENA